MEYFILILLVLILLSITIIDFKKMIIPDSLTLLIVILSLIHHINEFHKYMDINSIIESIKGFVFILLTFIIIFSFKKNSIGHGDFKLFLALSLIFNFVDTITIFFLSFNLAAFVSIVLIILKIKDKNDRIPFAPFISISTFLVIFYSDKLNQILIKYIMR